MTAPTYSSAILYNGIDHFSNQSLSYGGYLQSGGVAYTLTVPFYPDKFEWHRYTTYGTAGTIGEGVWYRDFPAGDGLNKRAIADNGATGNLNLVLETTNGVTVANTTGGFTDEHLTITGLAAGVVTTSAAHGLTTNDRVMITKVIGTVAAEVNNKQWVVNVQSTTTFKLYNVDGTAYTQVGAYSSSGQVNKMGPSLGVTNAPISYRLTLGTSIMGADNDVIYFEARKFNNYVNIGDVA